MLAVSPGKLQNELVAGRLAAGYKQVTCHARPNTLIVTDHICGAGAINAIAMSAEEERMVSVSEDGTAFLYGCTDLGNVTPLGFVQLPTVATAAAWATRPVHLVVACW